MSGQLLGAALTAAPAVAFVVITPLGGLTAGLAGAGLTAVGVFLLRLARREPLGGAVAGLALVGLCALGAGLTGEERGFFLLPTALPAVVLLVCVGSVVVRRPLTGVLLNRLAGGPSSWRHDRHLRRVYDVTTLIAVGVNVVNVALQLFFYAADQTAVLAVAHAATGPVFAALVAGTLVAVRRRLTV
jgi:hypothetical protein